MYIEAPPEMVERMMVRTGYNKDYDKEFAEMNEEGIFHQYNNFREGSFSVYVRWGR